MSTCMHGDLEQQRPTYQTVRTPRVRIRAVDHEGGRLAPAAQMIANAIEQPTESDALIPKAFMDVATEPHARLEEARREHIAKEAAACAVAVVALIEHASRRHMRHKHVARR